MTAEITMKSETKLDPRRALIKALETDPYGGEGPLGETAAEWNRREGESMRRTARAISEAASACVREYLNDHQRTLLAGLLRETIRLRGVRVIPLHDIVQLSQVAFYHCEPNQQWIQETGLDLAGDLLAEIEGDAGDKPEVV